MQRRISVGGKAARNRPSIWRRALGRLHLTFAAPVALEESEEAGPAEFRRARDPIGHFIQKWVPGLRDWLARRRASPGDGGP